MLKKKHLYPTFVKLNTMGREPADPALLPLEGDACD